MSIDPSIDPLGGSYSQSTHHPALQIWSFELRESRSDSGPLIALRGIDLHIKRGEVLGLVGDNGSGKSTFVKILAGFQHQDEGQIFLDEKPVDLHSVKDARRAGIETVYQDLALVPALSVYENLFLNREVTRFGRIGWLSNKKMKELARQHLA